MTIPRCPTNEELAQLAAVTTPSISPSTVEIKEQVERLEESAIAVFEGYVSDGPGFAGTLAVIVWPGGPDLVSVMTKTEISWTDIQLAEPLVDSGDDLIQGLVEKYGGERGQWGEDASHPRSDWSVDVANGDTSVGYWEWLQAALDAEGDTHE